MIEIEVACARRDDDAWDCTVRLHDGGRELSTHAVRVRNVDLDRLAPGSADPTALVEASFAFLLERESPGSILHSFELMEIARYFAEYEATMRQRIDAG